MQSLPYGGKRRLLNDKCYIVTLLQPIHGFLVNNFAQTNKKEAQELRLMNVLAILNLKPI